jgi:hypothetical protein
MTSFNLTIKKGSTFKQNIAYTDSAGVIINLTGYTARMQIRASYQSDIIHELTTENGGITITGVLGELDLLISATDTDTFDPITAIYDLEIISGVEVDRIMQGKVNITENVTR